MYKILLGLILAQCGVFAMDYEQINAKKSEKLMNDDYKIQMLYKTLTNLKIELAENRYKDDIIKSLRKDMTLSKDTCRDINSESFTNLMLQVNDYKDLLSYYKKLVADFHPIAAQEDKENLLQCQSQIKWLQKVMSENPNCNPNFRAPSYTNMIDNDNPYFNPSSSSSCQQLPGPQCNPNSNPNTNFKQVVINPNNAKSCVDFGSITGVRTINVQQSGLINVLCDNQTAGPGWILIQRRVDGSEDFYRGWNDYRKGFGSYSGEFFLGLENIHRITTSMQCELYIYMEKFNGSSYYVNYDHFIVGDEGSKYELIRLGEMIGNGGDFMRTEERNKFTTYDNDNDNWAEGNAAVKYHGAWWYSEYVGANLNGRYLYGHMADRQGLHWNDLITHKTVKMLLRPKYKK